MVTRIVNRYIEKMQRELPFCWRRKAAADLKRRIRLELVERCRGEVPMAKDAHEVLLEIGTPGETARGYRRRFELRRRKRIRCALQILKAAEYTAMLLGLFLIAVGVILAAAGAVHTLKPVMIGGVMALVVTVFRAMSSGGGRDGVFDSEENRTAALKSAVTYDMAVNWADDMLPAVGQSADRRKRKGAA